ncbi:hypothetical protein ACJRO7_026634 [Eucalyptus globulus]|uniref:AAA+ ATPase domain-containing protein n=1 Tax=Eucalyptus globulus TaxID=34317 RepID=A0ABD3JQ20_EUCGL
MEEIALCGASEVAKCLVVPIGRHCGYVMSSDRYVRQLNDEVKNLGDTRDEVQHSIDEARNNMKPIKPRVERWVNDVETVANEARDVLDYDGRAKKTCFYGWLPNPKARYHLGKKASRTVKDIQALMAGGQFQKVDFENPPPGLVGAALDVNSLAGDGGDFITDSRASIFQGIMKALNDEKVKVVGVYGPGGVGKTKLLEIVEEKLNKEGTPFHMIVKSKVSQTPDLTKIQFDIAYALGLKDLKDEPSEEGRRDLLFKRLQMDPSEKVLIILDDMWGALDLKMVGIPLGDESRNCKLLLTSRDKSVLEQKLHAEQTFRLEGLSDKEACMLFAKIVGDKLKDNEELILKAVQVVMKLAGLPLLITSVASTLKCSDVSTWENMIIKIEDPNIERMVKWSYDHLESEDAKCLFKLCGLIGGTIKVEGLLGIGIGLGLFEGFNNTVQDSRNRLNKLLDKLRSTCLLLDGGDDKENVTIHDLYGEVAVSTTFSGQHSLMMNSNYGSWPKEKLEKCWAIRQVDVGRDKLAELMRCVFPELKILMLSQPENWKGRPAHRHDQEDCCRLDFTYMKELRVLYLRTMHITTLPSSMEILGNLCSLYLDHCKVGDVANLGKLKALQILSFVGSKISRLPKDIGELTNLRSLNLSDCYSLKVIEPGALKGLINLEELHMKGSFDQWMGKDKLCNVGLAELKSLRKIASLEISIRDPTILEDVDLPFGNLSKFWIEIGIVCITYDLKGNVVGREFEGSRTMKLNLEGCDSILSEKWIQQILQKTQYLYLCELSGFKKSAHELCTQGFREVKYLKIEDSPSIKYIANSFQGLPLTAFKKLESLFLENLINLEKIYHGPIEPECFSKLKVVSVKHCDRLKYLWYLSDIRRLVHLEEIEVCKCNSLQSIVTHDAGEDIVSTNNNVDLPNVHRLILRELPNMTSFCSKAERTLEDSPIQVSLPHLESLVMVGLPGLEKILYGEPSIKYNGLKSLKIEESKSTLSIPKDWILKLPNLESMEIAGSPSLEVVFDLEELKVTGEVEILSWLSTLELSKLPNLRCMWKQDVRLQGISIFRNLKKLSISNTGLSFLFPVSMTKYLREIRDIEVKDCPNMKAVIVDEEGRNEEMDDIIEFPLLERLSIRRCPIEKFFSYSHGKQELITTTSDSQDTYFDFFIDQKISLPSLEKLILYSVGSFNKLANLTLKQDVQLQGISMFRNLEKLYVYDTGLSFLFSVSVAKCLREIRDITVKDCPNMKAVIVDEEGRDEGTVDIIEFPLLNRLTISCCPTEKFFSYPHGKRESIIATSDSQDTYSNSFFDQKVSLPSLEHLGLCSVGSFKRIWHDELPKSSFCELATLTLENCFGLLIVFPSTIIGRLHNLKEVKVSNLKCLESLFDCGSFGSNTERKLVSLPKLERVEVRGARRLKQMVKSDSHMVLGFPSLTKVEVENCSELTYLFPNYTVTTLGKLEGLWISKCERMKEVVPKEEGGQSKADVISFPCLSDLSLEKLDNLICFSSGCCSYDFASLRSLRIRGCCNFGAFIPSPTSVERPLSKMAGEDDELPQILFNEMVTFPNIRSLEIEGPQCKELWNNQIPTDSFWKLKYLGLECCDNLQHIAPSHMWKRLQRCLENLKVISCCSIEIIYEGDGMDIEGGELRWLVLRDLKNLRHIWQFNDLPNVPFPNLRDIETVSCPRLEMVFTTFTVKFLQQIKELMVESCEDMKQIAGHEKAEEATGTTITFSELTVLRLLELPKFKSFLPERYSLNCPSLRDLSIVSCGVEPNQALGDWEGHRQKQQLLMIFRQLIVK